MGHVLNNTIQDILIRKARMEGKNACWIPGTDHASIATESKVEAMLSEKGISKSTLSREEFLEYAWDWKDKYGGIIIKQLKTLGCSCDWDRERFTMDQDYTNAIMHAFVELYKEGLIYKGKRLVNWCPASKSAISDEEVIHKEISGKLWYFKYPIEKDKSFFKELEKMQLESVIKIELIAQIEPPKSNQALKQNLALEMLQNKFSKTSISKDDIKNLLIKFINNLQSQKTNANEKKLFN